MWPAHEIEVRYDPDTHAICVKNHQLQREQCLLEFAYVGLLADFLREHEILTDSDLWDGERAPETARTARAAIPVKHALVQRLWHLRRIGRIRGQR